MVVESGRIALVKLYRGVIALTGIAVEISWDGRCMKNREADGEKKSWFRSQRFFSEGNKWYFTTRENTVEGPFDSREDAEQELMLYLRNLRERANFGM